MFDTILFAPLRDTWKSVVHNVKRATRSKDQSFFISQRSLKASTKILNQAVKIGLSFQTDEDGKVVNLKSNESIISHFRGRIPVTGMNLDEIVTEFKEWVLDGAIRQSSPRYLAFPDSGNSLAANVADVLAGLTNQNLIATTKSAPTGTFVENQVLLWLRELIGYDMSSPYPRSAVDVGGIMTTGGTLANATALLVARCKAFPDSRKAGLTSSDVRPILIVMGESMFHYSHIASFWWLGLGEENIVYVATNDDYTIDTDDLERKIVEYNDGIRSKVVAVVAQAGNSRTTTIEKFERVSIVTRKYGVWLHVDACHGGVLLFSEKHRSKLRGIELADSVSIDPHKGLCIPYASSAVLFRRIEDINLIAKSTDITITKGSYDLGQITPFMGSRRFDSLKLWFVIKNLGKRGISSLVDYRFDLASSWKDRIDMSNFFASMNDVDLNSVVFSISPMKIGGQHSALTLNSDQISILNKKIHDEVYSEGILCIHTFDIRDYGDRLKIGKPLIRVLGVTLGNPNTNASDFDKYISYIEEKANRLIGELNLTPAPKESTLSLQK